MNQQDFLEALTVVAMKQSGWKVSAWDSRPDGFMFDIDVYCEAPRRLLVLVNASDSFFASQKKVWRNVSEPFEAAREFGTEILVANVAFLSSIAKSKPLYQLASTFFDASFGSELYLSSAVRKSIDLAAKSIQESKKAALPSVEGLLLENETVAAIASELKVFFRGLLRAQPKSNLPRLKRVWADFPEPKIVFGGNAGIRRRLSTLLVLGSQFALKAKASWNPALKTFRIKKDDIAKLEKVDFVRLINLHKFGSARRGLPGLEVSEVSDGLSELLSQSEEQILSLEKLAAEMVRLRPSLQEYIVGARTSEYVDAIAEVSLNILAQSKSVPTISSSLLECSINDEAYGVSSRRNWLLEALLQVCELSQTYVQERCSIHRLTHVVTGELQLNSNTSREIAEIIVESLPRKLPSSRDLANLLMAQRKYNLDTHSYGSPIYPLVLDIVRQSAGESIAISGYPDKNSAKVESWHQDGMPPRTSAGDIKVQFLLTDRRTGNPLAAIKIISAHEGHSADKRKEMAAKGSILRLTRSKSGFSARKIFLAIVLDGDWEHQGDSMGNALTMVARSGWSGIYDVNALGELARDLNASLRHA